MHLTCLLVKLILIRWWEGKIQKSQIKERYLCLLVFCRVEIAIILKFLIYIIIFQLFYFIKQSDVEIDSLDEKKQKIDRMNSGEKIVKKVHILFTNLIVKFTIIYAIIVKFTISYAIIMSAVNYCFIFLGC